MNMSTRLRCMFLACMVSSLALGQQTQPQHIAEKTVTLNLAAQPLKDALHELSRATGLKIMFLTDLGRGIISPHVSGTLTPEAALDLLLKGADLRFKYLDPQTIAVLPAHEQKSDSGLRPMSRVDTDSIRIAATDSVAGVSVNSPATNNVSGDQPIRGVNESSTDTRGKRQDDIQEVIVTAQKREEKLQNVPMSISVLTGANLNRSTVQGISEALNAVPGLATTEAYLGGGTNIAIRGVASSFPFFSGSSAVAYYLDSVPFGLVKSAIGPDADAYDLERVEVLRGPQGTLYGASALNGVVRILTHDADLSRFNLQARVSDSGTDHGGNNYRGDVMVNVPIIEDKLAARVSVGYLNNGGWIDQPNKKDVNDTEVGTYRLKLNAQPTDQLSVGLSAWISRSNSGAPDLGYTWDQTSSRQNQPTSSDYDAYALKVGYQFKYFSVSSSTSYLDYSNQGLLGLDIPAEGDVPGASFFNRLTSIVKSEEVNVNSVNEGPWRWSFGGMYRHATENRYQVFTVFPVPTIHYYDTSESYAGYGQLTRLFLNDRLELTAGLRHFHDHIPQQEQLAPGLPFVTSSSTAEANTPRGTVTWHANDQLMFYTSYSQGFRSGFPQDAGVLLAIPGFPAVKPDRLVNYELGSKGSLMDGRVSFDVSAYHIEWKDIQLQLNVLSQGVPNAAVVNGAAAKGNGMDFALSMRLAEGLTFSPYVSWNDLALTSDVFSGGQPLFSRGDRPSGSPETTAGVSANYSFPVIHGYQANFSASANYTSRQAYHSISAGGDLVQYSDPITISRASLSIDAPNHWIATLYADNINNEKGSTARVFFDRVSDWDARVRPLTVGLQVEYHFH
jgi:iron complex outermembrane receptor protein